MESVNLYSFYLFETEYSVVERLQNEYTSFLGLPMFRENYFLLFLAFVAVIYMTIQVTAKNNILVLQDFSHLILGIFFSLFFPAAFDYLYTTVSVLNQDTYINDLFLAQGSVDNIQSSVVNLAANTSYV